MTRYPVIKIEKIQHFAVLYFFFFLIVKNNMSMVTLYQLDHQNAASFANQKLMLMHYMTLYNFSHYCIADCTFEFQQLQFLFLCGLINEVFRRSLH